MKNKKFRVAALVLCAVIFCLPLMGLAAPVQASAGETTHCDCTVRCYEGSKNSDCPGCAFDISICAGKERVCTCSAKCTPEKVDTSCLACRLEIGACMGKAPEPTPPPAPICACDVKCTDTTKSADCPVCAADIAGCKGKATEPTPAPVCGCTVKCAAGAVNTACPVCKTDLTKCTGKAATPTPAPAGSYGITIVAPSGWYTKTAKVEIRVADENDTGWKKAEAKIERNGSTEDLTDAFAGGGKVYVSISENCTVYVTVTSKDGKTITKSRYIECFDRVAPTVKTGIDGKVLRVEATDELSGVDAVYIDGERFDDLTNGVLDVRLRDLGDDYDQLSVQAVDYAGNKSKTVQLKNPNYKAPSTDKGEDKPATTTPAPTPTTPPTTTAPGTTTTKPNISGGGNSGGATGGGAVPTQAELLSTQGLAELLKHYEIIRKNSNHSLRIEGILITMDSPNTVVSAKLHEIINRGFAGRVPIFKTHIPRSIKVAEAVLYHKTICEFLPNNPAALAYEHFVEELLTCENTDGKAVNGNG